MMILLSFVLLLSCARLAFAHIQMTHPYPFRSTFDPANNSNNVDYSMTSPLFSDGSNYPCKNYIDLSVPTKDTLTAGQEYTVKLAGSATHNGGSCQFSLSYDGGKNFAVIHSVIGGCPLQASYTFTVPQETPAAEKVLFAWSWNNHSGNREMYQNCSPVKIVNSNKNAVLRAPAIYKANVFPDGSCILPEGIDVVYPNPGKYITYGGAYAGNAPQSSTTLSNCAYDQNQNLVIQGSGSTSEGGNDAGGDEPSPTTKIETSPPVSSSSPPVESPSLTTKTRTSTQETQQQPSSSPPPPAEQITKTSSPAPGRPTAQLPPSRNDPPSSSTAVNSKDSAPTGAQQDPAPLPSPGNSNNQGNNGNGSIPSPPAKCYNNQLMCTSGGKSFSSCWDNAWVDMGKVANGTICKNGQIVADSPAKECADNTIKCNSKTTWSLCSNGAYIAMGSTAPGTQCLSGQIVVAPGARRHKVRRLNKAAGGLANHHIRS